VQFDTSFTNAKALHGGLVLDERNDDLSRACRGLSPYDDEIAGIDTGSRHALAVHTKRKEILRDVSRLDGNVAFQILNGSAERSRLDTTEDRDELWSWKLRQGKPTRFTGALRQTPFADERFQMPRAVSTARNENARWTSRIVGGLPAKSRSLT